MRCLQILLLAAVSCWQRTSAQDMNFPTATDIIWSSINFKTILDWNPKPTNYTYSVLLRSPLFQDWKKKCPYTTDTTCDVSDLVNDINSTYEVRIVSEIRPSSLEVVAEEFPYAEGPTFTPYLQTRIGRPKIQNYTFYKDHSRLTVVVRDTPTPYRNANNAQITVRDMFQNDFAYTLYYRKASSTGKKSQSSSTNDIVINTDKGEAYCFYVQASVPSRINNRVSQNSEEICTPSNGGDVDITILVAVGIAVALIVLIIVLSVVLCKCGKGQRTKTKETTPLNNV
ncbi:tissue factor isoform X1 [Ranitomeya imitator]|uniref:tissue factor isoform X1 n=1 Tax=Ranitomeya imitator TaxID=111125 RepID=UPI0037E7A9A0